MTSAFAAVHRPDAESEVSAIVRAESNAGRGMVVTGSNQPRPTLPGDAERAAISLCRLNRVIEHEAQDLTITCEAGCTLAALDELLASKGQRLAMEVANPGAFTIGGIIAARADGFLRAAFGGVRDQILGLSAVLAGGDLIKTGGRVVKNVTGYDLAKLFCGSLGTLGVITRATLRLRARPHDERSFVASFEDRARALAWALDRRKLQTVVTGLVVRGGVPREGSAGWSVNIRAEGRPATLDDLRRVIAATGHAVTEHRAAQSREIWSRILGAEQEAALLVRIDVPPSRLGEAAVRLERACADLGADWVIDAASGRIDLHVARVRRDVETTCGELALSRLAVDLGAAVSFPFDPFDSVERFRRTAAPSEAELDLARRVRRAFDPAGVFSAGRSFKELS